MMSPIIQAFAGFALILVLIIFTLGVDALQQMFDDEEEKGDDEGESLNSIEEGKDIDNINNKKEEP